LEQPKKPGPRDITDLKARLGLNRGPAPGGAPGGHPGGPAPGRAPFPSAGSGALPAPPAQPYASASAPAPAAMPPNMGGPGMGGGGGHGMGAPPALGPDPYASMRPPPGRQFDLRPVDDGVPAQNVRSGGFRAALIFGVIAALVGGVLGVGFGMTQSGRRAYNETNKAAKRVKAELETMHKTVTQVAAAIAMSSQRQPDKTRVIYDPKLIEDLEKIKLDPRPDTSRVFKVDYYRMPDVAVDNLMSYYYDTIAVYGEVERFVRRSKADKASLEAFAAKQAQSGQANYGVVFASGGKMLLANLVEVGQPVCKGGGNDCAADQLEGFQIRANSGAPWINRKVSAKPESNIVAPLDRTPLLESAMSGSPDQARMEQYRIRYANIQLLLARIAATHKQLVEAVNTAAGRQDMFSL
jgi:hypothetical protein